jgi:DNA-binding CsgD family transcriptional regulator
VAQVGHAHRAQHHQAGYPRREHVRGGAPAGLPDPDRLAALTAAFEADTGVPARFASSRTPRELASAVRLALYRVTQEALTNVRKHARPERVEVRLDYLPDEVTLAVEDVKESPPEGGLGYLTKDAGAAEIQQALHRVAGGQAALDPAVQLHLVEAIADGVPSGPSPAPLPDGLTPREAEVLTLIAAGLSNAEIAERLVVSEATVKSHVNHMLAKIGARDRAQAVGYAFRHGLVPR